jgi:hypothetical protein
MDARKPPQAPKEHTDTRTAFRKRMAADARRIRKNERYRRQHETPAERLARKEARKEATKVRRAMETPEERQAREETRIRLAQARADRAAHGKNNPLF